MLWYSGSDRRLESDGQPHRRCARSLQRSRGAGSSEALRALPRRCRVPRSAVPALWRGGEGQGGALGTARHHARAELDRDVGCAPANGGRAQDGSAGCGYLRRRSRGHLHAARPRSWRRAFRGAHHRLVRGTRRQACASAGVPLRHRGGPGLSRARGPTGASSQRCLARWIRVKSGGCALVSVPAHGSPVGASDGHDARPAPRGRLEQRNDRSDRHFERRPTGSKGPLSVETSGPRWRLSAVEAAQLQEAQMFVHARAPLSPIGRRRVVDRVVVEGWSVAAAAEAAGVAERTVYRWLARFRSLGQAGLVDRRPVPLRIPRRTPADRVAAICELRRLRLTGAAIAERLAMPLSTVSAVLRREGLGKRSRLEPPEPVNRYERSRPGELVHIDIKKLGRIQGGPGKRVTRRGERWPPTRTDAAG